jgi:hypothetical protein
MIIFYGRIELASLLVSLFPSSNLSAVDCISCYLSISSRRLMN